MTTDSGDTSRHVPGPAFQFARPLVRLPGQPVRPFGRTTDNVDVSYPFIVIRLMNAVYQAETIRVRKGRASVSIRVGTSFLRHPEPLKADGQVSDEAKAMLNEAVLAAVRGTGFRMCLVWGPAWCSFVEPDGSIRNSFEPPSGGFSPTGPVDFNGGNAGARA